MQSMPKDLPASSVLYGVFCMSVPCLSLQLNDSSVVAALTSPGPCCDILLVFLKRGLRYTCQESPATGTIQLKTATALTLCLHAEPCGISSLADSTDAAVVAPSHADNQHQEFMRASVAQQAGVGDGPYLCHPVICH